MPLEIRKRFLMELEMVVSHHVDGRDPVLVPEKQPVLAAI